MKTLVLGLGVSGQAVVELLLSQGKKVIAIDKNPELLVSNPLVQKLKEKGAEIGEEAHFSRFEEVEKVIFSSGIRPTHPFFLKARERGIEVIGEAELSLRLARGACIAITGTNGKTTVTHLVVHLLKESGQKARAVGNVGEALAKYFISPINDEILVVELSSYQLEMMSSPFFDIGIILNITPDHLDQYSSMKEYAEAKCRLKKCLKPNAVLYVNKQILHDFKELLTDLDCIHTFENIETFLPVRYRELGAHESENALAAWALVKQFGMTEEQFLRGLETFKRPPHRIEFVETIDGVFYYNDSKGTNIDAVIKAVDSMKGPVILIAGGVDKGASYAAWISPFREKIKQIFAIGQAAPKIFSELSTIFKVELKSSLEDAVIAAKQCAREGDCVLLSPGCASFDMFRDYAHRGEEFKKCIQRRK